MRTLIAAALIALLAGAAHAQGTARGKRHAEPQAAQKAENPAQKKAQEKAYNDALEKIPESNVKPDPWKNMR